MPIFNYVREHRRFIRYASDNKLTSSERLLWYALVEIINEESENNVWPDEFIRISNNRVLMLCDPMGIDTMVRARNGLKQRGLIEFKPGCRNKENPAYKVKLFYPDGQSGFYTQNTSNTGGNLQGNPQGNKRGNIQGNIPANMGNIYINQNTGYTENETDTDDEDDGIRARASAVLMAYLRFFGRHPNPAETDAIVRTGVVFGFSAEMIAKALEIAAEEGAKKPVQYVRQILGEWKDEHVMQLHQVDPYRAGEDIRTGRHGMGVYDTGDPLLDAQQREKEREYRRAENIQAGIEERDEA